EVLSEFATIEENLPPKIECLVQNGDQLWSLDDLPWAGSSVNPGHALRHTICRRIVSRLRSVCACINQRLRPRLVGDLAGFEIRSDVLYVTVARVFPYSGKIRVAIRQSRGRPREIRFAIRQSRDFPCRDLYPLCMNWRTNQNEDPHHEGNSGRSEERRVGKECRWWGE